MWKKVDGKSGNFKKTVEISPWSGKIITPVAVLAQLGERLLDVQEVIGSSPVDRRKKTTCLFWQVVFLVNHPLRLRAVSENPE